jgi:hypothetical protein
MNLNYRCKHEKLTNNITVKRAIIPVFLVGNNSKKIQFTAVLDSGSDFILIPREIADLLELKYDTTKKDKAYSFDGTNIVTAQSKIKIILEKDRETKSFDCKCAILLNKDFDHEDLIFGSSFFENFKITFDYTKNRFTIKNSQVNQKLK